MTFTQSSKNHPVTSPQPAFVLLTLQWCDDMNHFYRKNTQKSPQAFWFTKLDWSLKLSPQTLPLHSCSIIFSFWEKIGIIYCCHRGAHCPPLSQGQSYHDIELIRACFNLAFGGRKQIKSSGKEAPYPRHKRRTELISIRPSWKCLVFL